MNEYGLGKKGRKDSGKDLGDVSTPKARVPRECRCGGRRGSCKEAAVGYIISLKRNGWKGKNTSSGPDVESSVYGAWLGGGTPAKKKKTVTGLGIKSRGTIMKDRKNSGRYYLSPRLVWPWWSLAERVCGNRKKWRWSRREGWEGQQERLSWVCSKYQSPQEVAWKEGLM